MRAGRGLAAASVTVALALTLGGACERSRDPGEERSSAALEAEANAEQLRVAREQLLARTGERLRLIDAQILALDAEARGADTATMMQRLHEARDRADRALDVVRSTTSDTWQATSDGLEKTIVEVERTYQLVIDKLKAPLEDHRLEP